MTKLEVLDKQGPSTRSTATSRGQRERERQRNKILFVIRRGGEARGWVGLGNLMLHENEVCAMLSLNHRNGVLLLTSWTNLSSGGSLWSSPRAIYTDSDMSPMRAHPRIVYRYLVARLKIHSF